MSENVSNPNSSASQNKLKIGFAISSFTLGVLSIGYSFFLIGGILSVVGITLGIIHLKKHKLCESLARWGIGLSIFGLILTIIFGTFYYHLYKKTKASRDQKDTDLNLWIGVKAPDITLETLEGNKIKLSELKGKRIVLDFWASWCPPCVKEIPHFIQLSKSTSLNELIIIGISAERPENIKDFIKEKGINYPISLANDDLPSPYFNVESIPTTFFIDRNGIIQNILVGYHDFEKLKENALSEDYSGQVKDKPAKENKTH